MHVKAFSIDLPLFNKITYALNLSPYRPIILVTVLVASSCGRQ